MKFLKKTFLNLCFVCEVQWDHGAHTGSMVPLEPTLPPTQVLSDQLPIPCAPPGIRLPNAAIDHCSLLPRAAIGLHFQGVGDCGKGLLFSPCTGLHE